MFDLILITDSSTDNLLLLDRVVSNADWKRSLILSQSWGLRDESGVYIVSRPNFYRSGYIITDFSGTRRQKWFSVALILNC